jgi:hypothetical protein
MQLNKPEESDLEEWQRLREIAVRPKVKQTIDDQIAKILKLQKEEENKARIIAEKLEQVKLLSKYRLT